MFSGDFNGDGKVDLLSWKNTYWTMYFSTGTEFRGYSIDDNEISMVSGYQYLYYPSLSMVQNQDAYQVRVCVADFDGDGCSDILKTTGGELITILSRFDIHPRYSGGYHGCLFRKKIQLKHLSNSIANTFIRAISLARNIPLSSRCLNPMTIQEIINLISLA